MSGYYDVDRNPRNASGAPTGTQTAQGTMQWPAPHIGSTSEYLLSGWPYSLAFDNSSGTSKTKTITFKFVTKFITITAIDGPATVNLQGGDNFVIPADTNQMFEVKATQVAVTVANGDGFRLVAGLTNIPKSQYPASLGTQADVTTT